MLGWFNDLRFSAYLKIMSMQREEELLLALITLIAAYSPVILLLARETEPKPPYPNNLII
jgi:hypothetical protein